MDHRQPRAGYHTPPDRRGALAAVVMLAGTLAACLTPALAPLPPAGGSPGTPWEGERRALLAALDTARASAGLPPVAYDPLLERVGDAHCRLLLADGVAGHFARDGVPPYVRYLLAGGHGFHRENAASRSSSYGVAPSELRAILLEGLDRMLSETPPNDGHRATLLDPEVTHIGIGIAFRDGEVRLAHELAVQVATAWNAAPAAARPRERVSLAGRLAPPWEVAAVEELWEPLPRPLAAADANRITSYGYPPRRAIVYASEATLGRFAGGAQSGLEIYRGGAFLYTWQTGGEPGIEVQVIWARRNRGQRHLSAVAASCTVVTPDASLPPELERWAALR